MSGLTVPAGLRFHRVFPGQPRTTLAFLHLKTVVQNASLEAELLGWRRFRKLNYLVLHAAKFMVHSILQFLVPTVLW